jgi:hypothetical protein
MRIVEEEGIGMCSLAHNILGIRRVCWSSRIRTRKNDKWVNYSHVPTQTKQQVD